MKAEKNDKTKPEITEAVCGKSWPRGYKTFYAPKGTLGGI